VEVWSRVEERKEKKKSSRKETAREKKEHLFIRHGRDNN
jgi:hypothetical protein